MRRFTDDLSKIEKKEHLEIMMKFRTERCPYLDTPEGCKYTNKDEGKSFHNCFYYHDLSEKRRCPIQLETNTELYRPALCKTFYPRDDKVCKCKRGDACRYSHGYSELLFHPCNFRTKMCEDYVKGIECRSGKYCCFAHGEDDLRKGSVIEILPSTQHEILNNSEVVTEPSMNSKMNSKMNSMYNNNSNIKNNGFSGIHGEFHPQSISTDSPLTPKTPISPLSPVSSGSGNNSSSFNISAYGPGSSSTQKSLGNQHSTNNINGHNYTVYPLNSNSNTNIGNNRDYSFNSSIAAHHSYHGTIPYQGRSQRNMSSYSQSNMNNYNKFQNSNSMNNYSTHNRFLNSRAQYTRSLDNYDFSNEMMNINASESASSYDNYPPLHSHTNSYDYYSQNMGPSRSSFSSNSSINYNLPSNMVDYAGHSNYASQGKYGGTMDPIAAFDEYSSFIPMSPNGPNGPNGPNNFNGPNELNSSNQGYISSHPSSSAYTTRSGTGSMNMYNSGSGDYLSYNTQDDDIYVFESPFHSTANTSRHNTSYNMNSLSSHSSNYAMGNAPYKVSNNPDNSSTIPYIKKNGINNDMTRNNAFNTYPQQYNIRRTVSQPLDYFNNPSIQNMFNSDQMQQNSIHIVNYPYSDTPSAAYVFEDPIKMNSNSKDTQSYLETNSNTQSQKTSEFISNSINDTSVNISKIPTNKNPDLSNVTNQTPIFHLNELFSDDELHPDDLSAFDWNALN